MVLSGCASAPKLEKDWTEWSHLRPGAAPATVKRIAGEPEHTGSGNGQEFWFWEGRAARFKDGKLVGTIQEGDDVSWDKIGEGSSKPEVAYYVGLSPNVEPVEGGKRYLYQPGPYTRCLLTIADKTQSVTARRCETDTVAEEAARAQAMQAYQQRLREDQQQQDAQRQQNYNAYMSTFRQPARTSCTTSYYGGQAHTDCSSR